MSPQGRSPGSPGLKSPPTRAGRGGAVASGMFVRTLERRPSMAYRSVVRREPLDPLVIDAMATGAKLVGHAGAAVGVVEVVVDLVDLVDQTGLVPVGLGGPGRAGQQSK